MRDGKPERRVTERERERIKRGTGRERERERERERIKRGTGRARERERERHRFKVEDSLSSVIHHVAQSTACLCGKPSGH